ncbi:hypothetical protein ACFQ3Z_41645 [Streptomyces nogalater]
MRQQPGRDRPGGRTAARRGRKEALTGDRDARFVWLCNFEVENQWARS